MDCEKFEAALMDELYGELDELTSAAMKRHAAGCARCAGLLSGLSATRRLATLPVVEPPADLEDKILAAARDAFTTSDATSQAASNVVPIRSRMARVISLAGSWAMRPQTAMAAVFLVMIGTSVLLLTGKASRAPASASVTVTEQGSPAAQLAPTATAAASAAPEAYGAPVALMPSTPPAALARSDSPRDESPARAAPKPAATALAGPGKDDDGFASNGFGSGMQAPAAAAAPMAGGGVAADLARAAPAEKKGASPITAAIQIYQAGRYDDAAKAFDALAPSDPSAELWAARSVRESKGCRPALARFDRAAQRGSGSPTGWDALLEGALCYRAIGDFNNARTRLTALLGVDSHKDRARAELDRLSQMQSGQGGAGAGGAAKVAAPAPAPPPASRPAASAVDTSY